MTRMVAVIAAVLGVMGCEGRGVTPDGGADEGDATGDDGPDGGVIPLPDSCVAQPTGAIGDLGHGLAGHRPAPSTVSRSAGSTTIACCCIATAALSTIRTM
jgi:hypothetical protein